MRIERLFMVLGDKIRASDASQSQLSDSVVWCYYRQLMHITFSPRFNCGTN